MAVVVQVEHIVWQLQPQRKVQSASNRAEPEKVERHSMSFVDRGHA